jgi:hypothetical protein
MEPTLFNIPILITSRISRTRRRSGSSHHVDSLKDSAYGLARVLKVTFRYYCEHWTTKITIAISTNIKYRMIKKSGSR